jgi:peptidoglycan/xylan/chitin deacetylase (PgdA/CDA1 family)
VKFLIPLLLLNLLVTASAFSQQRTIAITFDDLPRGGDSREGRNLAAILEMTKDLLAGCGNTPITGFVNPGRATEISPADLQAVLALWRAQGAELGNHTATHPSYHRTPIAEYSRDILAAEPALRQARDGRKSRYFRHPFLHTGTTAKSKQELTDFLARERYEMAPVTVDTADYVVASVYAHLLRIAPAEAAKVRTEYIDYLDRVFAFFEDRSREVLGREPAQIILLHANQLNADTMPAMLAMMAKRGYKVVPLAEAMKDSAYLLPDAYFGEHGISWLHRWALHFKKPQRWEPDPPKWINDLYNQRNPAH